MEKLNYKDMLNSFKTSDFGEYSSEAFVNANIYPKPAVYPGTSHPRILFTENSVGDVRKNLTASENEFAYNNYIKLSETPCDGRFEVLTEEKNGNYNPDITATIEAKAFRYAMTGEASFGYEALYALKNAILTIEVRMHVGDRGRTYGHLMYVLGCVYDWCYDLMTDEDKAQLICGGVNILGKNQEAVYYVSKENLIPSGQGGIYSHGCEDEILVDFLSFAIACYNEAPEIYEVVAGRIFNDHVVGQNFMYNAGMHYEGSMYGSVRMVSTIVSNILINKMTDGKMTPFENGEKVVTASCHWIRPDGHVFRIGDINENNRRFQFIWFANNCFYAGNLYKNSYLKSVGYKYLNQFTLFSNMVAGLSVVQFLAINDPSVSHVYEGDVPLVYTATYPTTSLFAKSANDDKDAFGIYMTMLELGMVSHCHMECGSFQIFYKGPLAADSGAYDIWGSIHQIGYSLQTVASNSLLIYNPKLKDYINPLRPNMIYSGGQSIDKAIGSDRLLSVNLTELKNHRGFNWCTSLGVANVEKDGKYLYSYMGGDMTKAYDDITVDEVTRYMFSVATDNKDCPLAFVSYDRITSKDASYRKSALIHVQQEPHVTDDGFVVITNTRRENHGKMIVQNVAFDIDYTVIGGEGKEFWIPGVDEIGNYSLEAGRNLPHKKKIVPESLEEYGWGRVEISPKEAMLTNHMLTVMYVTDSENNDAPVKAEDISSESLAGVMIFGKAVLFPKNEKLLSENAKVNIKAEADCFACGVAAGKWSVYEGDILVETVTVKEGTNILTFTAKAGEYRLEVEK